MEKERIKRLNTLECRLVDFSEEITQKFFRFDNIKKIKEILDKKCDENGNFIFGGKKWIVNAIIYSEKIDYKNKKSICDFLNKTDIYEDDFQMLFKEYIDYEKPSEILIKYNKARKNYSIKKIL